MHLNLRKNGYLMKISQENFCILTRFFLTQSNLKLVVANSTATTQSIHASPLSQKISFDGTSHCFPSLHTCALADFGLTSNNAVCRRSVVNTSSPIGHFMYYHHIQRQKRMPVYPKYFIIYVLYKHLYQK
jgi:hypothetical protein